jgi:1-deoxy-D-xylulose-5-phosphate synthase
MILEKIKKSSSLKNLSLEDKKVLSQELRDYILEVVSKNGGHLASNLGVIELTIALESVFDLSKDKIIWDVGHQCYTHKILNGRYKEFTSLRKFKGISGFPKTLESATDCFNTGHSSTSISAAMGFAKARDIKKKNYNVISVIGDGALTGGMALEALNHAGSSKTKLIVILNDNEMSISKNIGGINNLLTNLRSKKNYTKSNDAFKNVILNIPLVGLNCVKLVSKFKNSIKQIIIPGMYFEEIGFRYLGPVDGHDIATLEDILKKAKELDGPTLIHVLTKKGNGYSFAENNPDKFHGIGSFNLTTGEVISKSSGSYSKVFGNKLVKLASKNKKIVAITAAMKDGTGLGLFASKFPERFFDVGIAEQHALTFAAGLASDGLIPFVSIYSSFYQRGYDQVIHDICLQNLPVIMCVDRAGAVGSDGETHQGLYDMSFFKIIPNITIMAPKNFEELELMMDFAIELKSPVVIRYPRGGESVTKMSSSSIKLGKAELLKKGNDLSIITIGNSVSKGIELANLLEKYNISCDVINCRFLKPLDRKTIFNSLNKTHNVIVIEDGTIIGGLSSSIKELLVDYNLTSIKSSFYAYPDQFIRHGTVSELEKYYKIDLNHIYKDTLKNFNKKND